MIASKGPALLRREADFNRNFRLNTGVVTPIVNGFNGVQGLAFSPTVVAITP